MVTEIYKEILERFCFEGFYFKDILVRSSDGVGTSVRHQFELIVFHPKKIIFFTKIPAHPTKQDAVLVMRGALNCLCRRFSTSVTRFVVCGVNRDGFFVMNQFNDFVDYFGCSDDGSAALIEKIDGELSFGAEFFDEAAVRKMCDGFLLSRDVQDRSGALERKRMTSDGTLYIRKHGSWVVASEVHPETLYLLAVFGGFAGAHLFFQKKYAKGVLYLFTFGLLGFGWLFDSLEILLGVYRDREGKYIAPLQSRIVGVFILGFLALCGWFAVKVAWWLLA